MYIHKNVYKYIYILCKYIQNIHFYLKGFFLFCFSSSSSVSYIGQHNFRNSFIVCGQQAKLLLALF